MREELYKCDVCNRECGARGSMEPKRQVIFTTEQDEGRSVDPYLELVEIDICPECKKRVLRGEAIYAQGCMGYNRYYFEKVMPGI
jgi:hypothetical protein